MDHLPPLKYNNPWVKFDWKIQDSDAQIDLEFTGTWRVFCASPKLKPPLILLPPLCIIIDNRTPVTIPIQAKRPSEIVAQLVEIAGSEAAIKEMTKKKEEKTKKKEAEEKGKATASA